MKTARLSALILLSILGAAAGAQQVRRQEVDHFARGLTRMERGDLDGAIADFTAAVAERPDHAEAFFERGAARCMKIEVDAALADFQKAISLAPDRADFYKRRAQCRMRYVTDNEERREVMADIDLGLAVDPKDADLYLFRGLVKIGNEDFESALADYDRAVALAPDTRGYYSSRAFLKIAFLGDYAGAAADASRAIELGPDDYDYESYAIRGKARQAQGMKAAAAQDFRRCRRLDSRCEKSLEKIDRLMRKTRERRKAG